MSRPSDVTGSWLSANSLDLALTADDVALPEDRVCLDCGERPIIGKPYSVYCCVECYDRWVHCFECGNDLPCEVHRDESNTPEMPVGERNAEHIADYALGRAP